MATTKNQVIDILQWSSQEYEDRLFFSMLKWCQLHGGYPSVIQQLLANRRVNNWFMHNFTICELEFLKITEIIPNTNLKQLEGHYYACTSKMQEIFPKPLISEIKKNKDFSNILVTNTPVTYAN
jgi:hypothetical protein